MFWFSQAVQWTGILLLVAILLLVRINRLHKAFPIFTTYISYITLETFVRSISLSEPHLYYYIYWSTEPGAFLLRIWAVHESFMHVFRSFYLLRRFRVLLPGTALVALLASGLKAYMHPAS